MGWVSGDGGKAAANSSFLFLVAMPGAPSRKTKS